MSITTIGVVTADRPWAVERSLASIVHHCDAHGRRPRLLVIDGSRQAHNRAATRTAVEGTAASSQHEARYIGETEAARLRDALARQGAPPLALAPGSAGANRSLLLLLSAGEQILTVDDDIVFETWASPRARDGLVVAGHDDLREIGFFESRAAALRATRQTPIDLLAAHGSVLGRPLATLMATSPPPDLTQACHHLLTRISRDRAQTVRVTLSGLAGDAGTYCPYRRLLAAGPVRARLWASEQTFTLAMTSREVCRIAAATTVTHNSSCMAYCMGIANTALVPPFPPVGGNEDGVFGLLSAACDPATLFCHVPVGVIHDSDRPSAYTDPPIRSARESRLSELVIALVRRFVSAGLPSVPDARMRRIGEMLSNLGDLPDTDLLMTVTEVTMSTREDDLARAFAAAEHPGCPAYWRDGLARYRDEFARHVRSADFVLPVECRRAESIASGWLALRNTLRELGAFIAAWPDVWTAARALNTARSGM